MPAVVVNKNRVKCKIVMTHGPKEVDALLVGSLFVVHECVAGKGWSVSHKETGRALCLSCFIPSEAEAVKVAEAVEKRYGRQLQSSSVEKIQASGITEVEMRQFIASLL